MGAIPSLIALLDENEAATQRLAASALCNLLANHDENKRLVWDLGFMLQGSGRIKTRIRGWFGI